MFLGQAARRDSDSDKVPAALYDRLTDTPTYVARTYKVQLISSFICLKLFTESLAKRLRAWVVGEFVTAELGKLKLATASLMEWSFVLERERGKDL